MIILFFFLYLHLRVTIENIFDKNTKLAYKVGIPHAVVVFSQIYFVGIYNKLVCLWYCLWIWNTLHRNILRMSHQTTK